MFKSQRAQQRELMAKSGRLHQECRGDYARVANAIVACISKPTPEFDVALALFKLNIKLMHAHYKDVKASIKAAAKDDAAKLKFLSDCINLIEVEDKKHGPVKPQAEHPISHAGLMRELRLGERAASPRHAPSSIAVPMYQAHAAGGAGAPPQLSRQISLDSKFTRESDEEGKGYPEAAETIAELRYNDRLAALMERAGLSPDSTDMRALRAQRKRLSTVSELSEASEAFRRPAGREGHIPSAER